jgi:2'-5' RNA ligase
MKNKIFISLSVPDKTKRNLIAATEKWQDLPVKWVREQNLHITLAFLGFIDESALADICEKVGAAAGKNAVFDIDFSQISLFPSASEPRLVALVGEASEELKNLVNDIEDTLGISNSPKKTFRPHITLGRLRAHKWAELNPKPEIEEKFEANIPAGSVDIMASDFKEGKNKYSVIESCPLE